MKNKAEYVWLIAHIDKKKIHTIEKDFKKSNQYIGMEASVPCVQVLKKQFKKKDYFDSVPLLFNYGFFKIPLIWALSDDLLEKFKKDITCISSWVKDRAKAHSTKSTYEEDEDGNYIKKYLTYLDVSVATVTEVDVMRMEKYAKETSIHSSEEVEKVKEGDMITLMGYPFEGMNARVISIETKRKKMRVQIQMDDEDFTHFSNTEVEVHFDSVFWSIYKGSYHEDYNLEKTLKDYQTPKNKEEDEN